MQACIFNIQKFSIHDGPGVRTTVFFKGCPLRCFWCSNPESIAPGVQMLWRETSCLGCGACADVCPASAIVMTNGVPRIDHNVCTGCSLCANACPRGALSQAGAAYALEQVVDRCLEDKVFYDDSGGGVTLSGGEVLAQPAFAVALLDRLRAEGVRTALETNGYADEAVFLGVATHADTLLFDVKHYNEEKHREGAGVSNKPVLRNLAAAVDGGMDVMVRIPVIRGYNSSLEDARGFAELLTGMRVDTAHLLPFHQMGESKYAMLGLPYALGNAAPLHKEDVEDFRQVMLIHGMKRVFL